MSLKQHALGVLYETPTVARLRALVSMSLQGPKCANGLRWATVLTDAFGSVRYGGPRFSLAVQICTQNMQRTAAGHGFSVSCKVTRSLL